jgi:hypothetical protein|tara:strand:- start:765 stop:1181 length:417 start_codon:yes stop_codon:yes gene_type:complete
MGSQGRFTKTERMNPQADDVVIPSGVAAKRPGVPQVGSFRLNTTNAKMEFFNGTEYKTLSNAGFVGVTVDSFTGDNSTTTFTMSVTPNAVTGILVFVGQVYQKPTTHYTVSSNNITFDEAVPVGEPINVIHGFDSTSV